MKYQSVVSFEITSIRRQVKKENGKRVFCDNTETVVCELPVDSEGIHCGYGYYMKNQKEVDTFVKTYHTYTVDPNSKYVVMHYVTPKEGDIIRCGNRTFTVGKRNGFINWNADLLENGRKVASIFWEDYNKD